MTSIANGFDPDHFYYDPLGNPISVEEWGALYERDRTLCRDTVTLNDHPATLATVYLGFVCPGIDRSRLFGTAIRLDNSPWDEIQGYDSEEEALLGHQAHREAIGLGFHCALCSTDSTHPA